MSNFYQVKSNIDDAPVRDYLFHGWVSRREFEQALQRLVDRWCGRIGESVSTRHDFLLLRFFDTLGGKPDEAWLPTYLLQPVEPPVGIRDTPPDEQSEELDRIFGFE